MDDLLTHFPDLANPIARGWLALRAERWRLEAGALEPRGAAVAPRGVREE
ncbi:MAG: hypothetical protein JRJ84_22615 [Deltaproteobacteria bacterium]|nr:hypothetical protein [Deltaproteobacteria bacterium]